MKLHLGCGNKLLDGFINVDIREDIPGVDLVDDIVQLSKVRDRSADLIYACHVLEHVKRHERVSVLETWHSKLGANGTLRIAVPDFEKVVKLYNRGTSCDSLIGFLYGGQDYEYNFHYYCWDYKSLEQDLTVAGFTNVRRYDWRQTEHAKIDDYSQSYLPHMDKEHGELMSLNVEATKEE